MGRIGSTGIRSLLSLLVGMSLVVQTAGEARAQAFQWMEHFPVTHSMEGKPIKISVRLRGGRTPVYVRVYFRRLHDQNYRHVELRGSGDRYEGEIPAQFVKPPVVQYFVMALFPNQKVESLPELNPYGRPYQITIEESKVQQKMTPEPQKQALARSDTSQKAGVAEGLAGVEAGEYSTAAEIQILSPEPFDAVAAEELVIAAGFVAGAEGIDSASVRISLDGEDMTEMADISAFLVTLSPGMLAPGDHTVVVWARDVQGRPVEPASWTFTISGAAAGEAITEEKSYEGRVFAEIRQEKFTGEILDIKNLGANLDGQAGPFTYSGMFLVTSLEDPRFQPRNRFTLNLSSKFLDLGVGDTYPYFNELVMWGRRVRGITGALKFGLVNFQVAYGETNRLVKPLYAGADSLIERGSYRQNLLAGRLSFGSGENFQLGLLALKAKDDDSTLKIGEGTSTPRDNLVAGADLLLALDAHRFELKASAAFSLVTNDISQGPATKAEIDSTFQVDIPFDPAQLKNIIILNESTVPLDPLGLTSLAYQVNLNLNYFGHFFQAGFKQIGPEYNSFGLTYLRGNIRGFYINDRMAFFGNKVYTTIGFEKYTDNFGQEDDNPAIDLQTINFSVLYNPGPNFPSINISLKNYLRNNGVDRIFTEPTTFGRIDTTDIRELSLTRDLTVNLNYTFQAFNLKHDASLSVITSKLIDKYQDSRPTSSPSQDYVTAIQMLTLKTDFQRPLTTTLTYATNRNESTQGLSVINFDLFAGRADYRMFNNKLNLYGGVQFINAGGSQSEPSGRVLAKVDYNQLSLQMGLSFQPNNRHLFMFDFELIDYRDNGGTFDPASGTFTNNPSYKNSVFRLFYEFRL